MISTDGVPLLMDFGISHMIAGTSSLEAATYGYKGTIRWQAPELVEGTDNKGHTSKASDVYAFAMTCLEVSEVAS